MDKGILISGAKIVNEGLVFKGNILIANGKIKEIFLDDSSSDYLKESKDIILVDASERYLLPGIIDDQVHFRDPGLTHKGDLLTESRAAVAGGITSFMDMPNTVPHATTLEILEEKFNLAAKKSLANYSFFLGAANDNLDQIKSADPSRICGLKVFMGASTGNMLVDDAGTLESIFALSPLLIAVHAEEESIIRKNLIVFKEKYGDHIPVEAHPLIRSEEACFLASEKAVALAKKNNSRLHVIHVSTRRELELFDNTLPLEMKRITSEVCVHHLWFDDRDYARRGTKIKWNPAIKKESDKTALFEGLLEDRIDIIATDHAPHTREEKQNTYLTCPSGAPLVQHSLAAMLEFFHGGRISLEKIVEKMCHAPATLYRIKNRGFIRKGYCADLVLVDLNSPWEVNAGNILYKCGWSPFEGITFTSRVTHTFVNGKLVFDNGMIDENFKGERLEFY